jgi:hypothetical protein
MVKTKNKIAAAAVTFLAAVTLAGCSNSNSSSAKSDAEVKLSEAYNNKAATDKKRY